MHNQLLGNLDQVMLLMLKLLVDLHLRLLLLLLMHLLMVWMMWRKIVVLVGIQNLLWQMWDSAGCNELLMMWMDAVVAAMFVLCVNRAQHLWRLMIHGMRLILLVLFHLLGRYEFFGMGYGLTHAWMPTHWCWMPHGLNLTAGFR